MAHTEGSELLTPKELAARLRKHVSYIYAMKRRGFPMPGKVATIVAALLWLEKHPDPRRRAR